MRVALYIRVSTQEQAKSGLSLGDQKTSLMEYAKEHRHTVVGVYEDAGISARKSYKKRPAMMQLLKDCEAKLFDIVLFIKLDRWFRSVPDYYEVQPILERNGVFWQATKEDYETVTASGRFKVNIMLSVAQDEADRTSERIKFVNEGKRARGEPTSGSTPYGYIIGPDKKFAIDPETEPIVKAIFEIFPACGSIRATMLKIEQQFDVKLTRKRLDNVLRNTAFYGRYFDQDDVCPPYISKHTYDMIQSMRYKPIRLTETRRVYLFSGLITCADCGKRMSGKSVIRNKIYAHYLCDGHSKLNNGCQNTHSLSELKIEAALLDTLTASLEEVKRKSRITQEKTKPVDYSKDIKKLHAKLDKLKDLFLNDLLTLDEYKADQIQIKQKIAELEEKSASASPTDYSSLDWIYDASWKSIYKDSSKEDKRAFWRSVLKQIWIDENGRISYEFRT